MDTRVKTTRHAVKKQYALCGKMGITIDIAP